MNQSAAFVGLATRMIAGHVRNMHERYRILKQICLVYYAIIGLILLLALLKLFLPSFVAPLLSEEMGIISLACFLAIQISFELDEDATKRPYLLKAKAAFYILDLCILVNAKVPELLTIGCCVFSGVQLFVMFMALSKEQRRVKKQEDATTTPQVTMSQTTISALIILINFAALVLGGAKGFWWWGIDADVILATILGSLVMYYVQTLIK